MDARPLPPHGMSLTAGATIAPGIARSLVVSLENLFGVLGAIVCVRSLAGSLVNPLHPAGLLFAGGLLAAWSIGVRATSSDTVRSFAPRAALALAAAPAVAAALVALALSVPGTSAAGL